MRSKMMMEEFTKVDEKGRSAINVPFAQNLLKGDRSPTRRYTIAHKGQNDKGGEIVFHTGGASWHSAAAGASDDRRRRGMDSAWVVAYESLSDDHPFRDANHCYHTEFGDVNRMPDGDWSEFEPNV